MFIVINKNFKSIFASVLENTENNVILIPPGAYELDTLNAEFKRNFVYED